MRNFIKNAVQSQKVFYRYFRRKGWKRFLKENILESEGSNTTKAKSIALGVFIGLSPFWGFHTFLVIFLAGIFRFNKVLSFMFSNISLPPFIPFIIYGSIKIGEFFIGGSSLSFSKEITLEAIKSNIAQYFIGSILLASFGALASGFFSYFILKNTKNPKRTLVNR